MGIEAILREKRAETAGIAKAALWVEANYGTKAAYRMLKEFFITEEDLTNADAVTRIHNDGQDLDDAIAILTQ